MSTITKKRRRWPWIILTIAALACGLPLAWDLRPLSSAERSMVGVWQSPNMIYVLGSNRRYASYFHPWCGQPLPEPEYGSWSAHGDQFRMSRDSSEVRTWSWSWRNWVSNLRDLVRKDQRTTISQLRFESSGTALVATPQPSGSTKTWTLKKLPEIPVNDDGTFDCFSGGSRPGTVGTHSQAGFPPE